MSISKKSDSESQEYWRLAQETREKIRQWPEWKREIRLTEHSTGFGQEEPHKGPQHLELSKSI
jgi:hypothetical protein